MARLLSAAAMTILGIAYAEAGCDNYKDGSLDTPPPRAVICFSGKCENTTLNYECANVYSAQAGYANGWKVEVDVEKKKVFIARNGRLLKKNDFKKITCREIDKDSCALSRLQELP